MQIRYALRMMLIAGLGVGLGVMGFNFANWQFWFVLLTTIAYGALATYPGSKY